MYPTPPSGLWDSFESAERSGRLEQLSPQNVGEMFYPATPEEMLLDIHSPDGTMPLTPEEMTFDFNSSDVMVSNEMLVDTESLATFLDPVSSNVRLLSNCAFDAFFNELEDPDVFRSPHKEYELKGPPQDGSLDRNLLSHVKNNLKSFTSDSFRCRPTLKSCTSSSSARSIGPLRSPDRFVPKRALFENPMQSFRANIEPSRLSSSERILRSSKDSSDVFFARRRVTSPESNQSHVLNGTGLRGLPRARQPGGPHTVGIRTASGSLYGERRVSLGSTWAVGGVAPHHAGISNGRGGLTGSGTNAPLFTTTFTDASTKEADETESHARRIAKALDLDQAQRVLQFIDPSKWPIQISGSKRQHRYFGQKVMWSGTEWVQDDSFAILDAPNLRDDFYCSVLAYSHTCHTMAVGLGPVLYSWSEMRGVDVLDEGPRNGSWLTSVAFSSTQGCKCILAYGRSDHTFALLSLYDGGLPRFQFQQPCPIACISWKPNITLRMSNSPYNPQVLVKTEDLIVGDETGSIFCYVVEWPDLWDVETNGWMGMVTHVATISIHSQQICGLAWSVDGEYLGTGGNDNLCCLFESAPLFNLDNDEEQQHYTAFGGASPFFQRVGRTGIRTILTGAEKHRWQHGAAVKAIAFCPWFPRIVATGGGSNDKCIHFFHVASGACLATISVAAQVTSLIWSTTRREIAATFGYAQPEHPYRIAVFSWPKCEQVAAIPWEGEHRALYAISYPGGPNENRTAREGGNSLTRTAREGCIVVAASDESVKFHEVWTAGQKATSGGEGLLGGSDILEGLEGIDKEGEIIR